MKKTLIVGAGLAGMTLHQSLQSRGVNADVVDDAELPSSTEVATGMYNPIVFRRLNKSWMIDDLLPEMKRFFESLHDNLGYPLPGPMKFFKRIPSEDYGHIWEKRQAENALTPYLGAMNNGLGEVHGAGIIPCSSLHHQFRTYLQNESLLINERFDFQALVPDKSGVSYKGRQYERVFFCEGPAAINNPYFQWLPFKLCKGEWIVVKSEPDLLNHTLNVGHNIIPLGDGQYKVSATYAWDNIDWASTDAGRIQLEKVFQSVFNHPYSVLEHRAGVRPTVADRRPYLGTHPAHARVHIFNGLGSKGLMLAPWFANHLCDHVLDAKELMNEVDIHRHIKRYYQSTN